ERDRPVAYVAEHLRERERIGLALALEQGQGLAQRVLPLSFRQPLLAEAVADRGQGSNERRARLSVVLADHADRSHVLSALLFVAAVLAEPAGILVHRRQRFLRMERVGALDQAQRLLLQQLG